MLVYHRCHNIEIDGSGLAGHWFRRTFFPDLGGRTRASNYEADVLALLETLIGTRTGWAVIRGLYDAGATRHTKACIVPFSKQDQDTAGSPFAHSTSPKDAAPRGVQPFMGLDDDPRTPNRDERYEVAAYRGTGKGSDSEVHFSPLGPAPAPPGPELPLCDPKGGGPTSNCRLKLRSANLGPAETLLHELFHALRDMRGKRNQVPTLIEHYDNEEEFFAVLVTNVFMSERGKTLYRAGHHSDDGALNAKLSTSESFLGKGEAHLSLEQRENRRLVNKLVSEDWDLCRNIQEANTAAFNPVAEYLAHSKHYPLTS